MIVHPDAEPDQRYEMFIIRAPSRRPQNLGSGWIPGLPREPGADSHPYATYRYHSPDGINWTAVEGPLLRIMALGDRLIMPYTTPMGGADQASYYLLEDGTYELMQKVGTEMHPGGYVPYDCFFPYGRRVLARRTSPDGSNWTPPEVIVEPDWKDPHDQQFMELMPHTVRGGYIGLLCCYNVREQTIDWQWAGSRDRRIWNRPSRRPTLPNAPLGDYGGGMLWPTHQLIEDGDRVYMYYSGLGRRARRRLQHRAIPQDLLRSHLPRELGEGPLLGRRVGHGRTRSRRFHNPRAAGWRQATGFECGHLNRQGRRTHCRTR